MKFAEGEGFGEAGAGVQLQEVLEAVLDDVAGHEKHAARGVGFAAEQLLVEVHAVEAGHLPVGDDDVVVVAQDEIELAAVMGGSAPTHLSGIGRPHSHGVEGSEDEEARASGELLLLIDPGALLGERGPTR